MSRKNLHRASEAFNESFTSEGFIEGFNEGFNEGFTGEGFIEGFVEGFIEGFTSEGFIEGFSGSMKFFLNYTVWRSEPAIVYSKGGGYQVMVGAGR